MLITNTGNIMKNTVLWDVKSCSLVDVSEERTASIFKIEK
jgi:hypothetical protein